MARKSSIPALYEKMQNQPSPVTPALTSLATRHVEPAAPRPIAREVSPENWLTPGRTVRLPVGYILLGGAVVLTVLIVAYVIAFQRGRAIGRDDMRDMAGDLNRTMTGDLADDPLVLDNTNGQSPATPSKAAPALVNRNPNNWGPIVPLGRSDPRQKMLNYFVLMETNDGGARKVAEFCRQNGLETYVVSGKNDRLRRVIVLPGFDSDQRSSREVKLLEERITETGEKWKKAARGNSDFRGFYPSLYTG